MGTQAKILVIVEVILVRFGLLAVVQVGLLRIPGVMDWQLNTLGYLFTTGVVFVLFTLLLLFITRRNLKVYGLNFENLRYHFDIAGTCFIPFVLVGVPFGLGVDYQGWGGAFILAALQIGLLFVIARLLKKKASLGLPATAGALFLFTAVNPALGGSLLGKLLLPLCIIWSS